MQEVARAGQALEAIFPGRFNLYLAGFEGAMEKKMVGVRSQHLTFGLSGFNRWERLDDA